MTLYSTLSLFLTLAAVKFLAVCICLSVVQSKAAGLMARVTSQRKPSKKKEKKERNAGVAVRFGSQVGGQTETLHPDKLGWPWCCVRMAFIALRNGCKRVLLYFKRYVVSLFLCYKRFNCPPSDCYLRRRGG